MKEKNRAEEWFRAKHDELAGTARANLAAHDLEPGQEAYHLDSLHYATWADAAWWDEQARAMWDEVDDIPDDGLYWTSVED